MLEWRRRAAPCALALTVGASSACEEEPTRPGLASDCNDPECLDARGGTIPLPLPTAPGAGAGRDGGLSGAGAAITGAVSEIISQDLVTAQSLRGEVEVRTRNASATRDIVAEPAADGTYRLEGIEPPGAAIWVGVGNFRDPPIEPFLDTIQAVDTSLAAPTHLVVWRRDTLLGLAATSFINPAVVIDPSAAHLVVQFVNRDRRPLQGVQLTFPEPETVSTAYDAGDAYGDALLETSTRGVAILLNLDAPRWPGGPLRIIAEVDGAPFMTDVQLVRSAITVVTAVVPDP